MIKSNFNGERLRTARLYRNYTITSIAEELGITKQMISKYENDKTVPSSEMLLKLESILSFPRNYFFENDNENIKIGNTYFRSLASTSKKDQEVQNIKLVYLSKIYRCLADYINFPKLNLPELSEVILEDPEKASLEIREYWKLGNTPITNMVRLLESNGIIVSTNKTNITSIDAFTQKQEFGGEDFYFVVLGQDKGNAFRRQFDAAHELAHILLHDPFLNLNEVDKDENREMEKQANEFAAALLLPKEEFIRDASMHPADLNHYLYLKKKWNVSVSAMTVRAYNLDLISYNQYHYLQRQISQRKWRKEEPYDREVAPSSPILLKKATLMLLENKKISGPELLDRLSTKYNLTINAEEFEDLIGIDRGTLLKYRKDQSAVIIDFKK